MNNQVLNLRTLNTFFSSAWVAQALVTMSLLLAIPDIVYAVGVDENSGSATHSIPLELPPGPGGLTPGVGITYSGTTSHDLVGDGWGISGISYIGATGPRATAIGYKPGVFRLVLNGLSQELVSAGKDPSGAIGHYFRTKQETYLRILKVNMRPPPGATDTWIVTDKAGVQYFFGESAASVIGSNGRMYLDRVRDPHGNEIKYHYKSFPDDNPGQFVPPTGTKLTLGPELFLYPSTITYGPSQNMEVEFRWVRRPFAGGIATRIPIQPRLGILRAIQVERLLKDIVVRAGGHQLRRYAVSYSSSVTNEPQFVQPNSVAVFGADDSAAMPPIKLLHHRDWVSNSLQRKVTGGVSPPGLDDSCTRLIDWNNDGRPDVVRSLPETHELDGSAQRYEVYLNGPGGNFSAPISVFGEQPRFLFKPGRPGHMPTVPKPESLPTLCETHRTRSDRIVRSDRSSERRYVDATGNGSGDYIVGPRESLVPNTANTQLVDIDGDGLPDILHHPGSFFTRNDTGNTEVGSWVWRRNLGNNRFTNELPIRNPPPVKWIDDPRLRLIDMNGDTLPDFVWFFATNSTTSGSLDWHFSWWANAGDGNFFDPTRNNYSNVIEFRGSSTTGPLPTRVCSTPDNRNGLEFRADIRNPSPFTCIDSLGVITVPDAVNPHIGNGYGSEYFHLADMNDDGGPDIVYVNPTPPTFPGSQWNYVPIMATTTSVNGLVTKLPATGGLFLANKINLVTVTALPHFDPAVRLSISGNLRGPFSPPFRALVPEANFVDMNGDGRTDILISDGRSDPYYLPAMGNDVLTHPRHLSGYANVPGISTAGVVGAVRKVLDQLGKSKGRTMADMNGDGFADIVVNSVIGPRYQYFSLDHSQNHRLLERVTEPLGGSHSLTYSRKGINNGGARWVVSKLIGRDGMGLESVTDYAYADGVSVFWPYNEFRGFRTVTRTDPRDHLGRRSSTRTTYNQSNNMRGLIERADKWSGSHLLLSVDTFSYRNPVISRIQGLTPRPELWRATKTVYDGKSGFGKQSWTEYRDYDKYGQARVVEVGGSSHIVSTPNEITVSQFAYNSNAYIVNRPQKVDVYRSVVTPDHRIRGMEFDYDDLVHGAAPIKGDVTRRRAVLLSGIEPDPETLYSYDSFGNRVGTIEPMKNTCSSTGFSIKVDYDPVFATYPVKVTNALCQETTSTYWGINTTLSPQGFGAWAVTGLLATETDPNGVTSESYWDAHSRPVATVVPPDTIAMPTTHFAYSTSGAAPSTVESHHRETTGVLGTMSEYTYLDGLGRAIQTKHEGENAGTWITVDSRYNRMGLIERVSQPYLSSGLAYSVAGAVPATTTFYDSAQRPIRVTSPDHTTITKDYNQWTTTTTDAKGAKTVRHFGRHGQLTAIREAVGGGYTTYAETDLNGEITRTITDDEGNEIKTTFDSLGRKITSSDADRGRWRYQYDANGNLLIGTDAKGQETRFLYDNLNRVQVKTLLDVHGNTGPGSTVNYQYDDATAGANRIGRLWQVGDDIGFTTISYDAQGNETNVDKFFWRGDTTNLVPNPGFENGIGSPSSWSGSGMVLDGSTAHSGRRSMSISNPVLSPDLVNTWQPYDAAKRYTADAWIKTIGLTNASAKVKFVFQNASSVETGSKYSTTGIEGTADWSKVSASLAAGAAPAGTTSIQVGIEAVTSTGGVVANGTWNINKVDYASYSTYDVSSDIDSTNNVHISYYNGYTKDLMYARWDGTVWTTQIVDSYGDVGYFSSIAVDSAGNPHIGYWDKRNADLKYASWNGSTWDIETVDSVGNVGVDPDIAMDGSGNPHIVYSDSANADLKYARWTGTAWVIETVDSQGYVGYSPSIALDGADNPHIGYHSVTSKDLKYARRNGSVWVIESVDSAYNAKVSSVSIALDSTGKPHIAYYVTGYYTYDLRYASWNGSAWDVATVDSTGDVGGSPSLALDPGDNPHIGYIDASDWRSNGIKLAKWDGAAWIIETVDTANPQGPSLSIDNLGQTHLSYMSGRFYRDLKHAVLEGATTAVVASGTAWFDDITLADGSSGPVTYTTGYTYDSLGRLVTMTYPDGEVVRRTYNKQGLLETLSSDTYGMQYINNLDYNPQGSVALNQTGNGVRTDYSYFPGNFRLHTLKTTSAAAAAGLQVHQDLTYTYDTNGNILSIADAVGGASQAFGYDEMNRLTSASSAASPTYNYSYTFDSLGRMLTAAGVTYKYPPVAAGLLNPLAPTHPHAPTSDGSNNYSYDINGNLVSRGSRHFIWNTDGHLIKVADGGTTLLENHYDFAGKRVMKLEGGITTRIPFPHYRTVDGVATKYYFANGQRIAERTGSSVNDVSFYYGDHLGSSNVVLDWNANEIKNTTFYPYGGARAETGNKVLVHQFTGQEKDSSTGLYNYGARYYDTALRHFISADAVIRAGDPQSFNRYSYVRNNPVKLIDPTGNEPCSPLDCNILDFFIGVFNRDLPARQQALIADGIRFSAALTASVLTPGITGLSSDTAFGSMVNGTLSYTTGGIAVRTVKGEDPFDVKGMLLDAGTGLLVGRADLFTRSLRNSTLAKSAMELEPFGTPGHFLAKAQLTFVGNSITFAPIAWTRDYLSENPKGFGEFTYDYLASRLVVAPVYFAGGFHTTATGELIGAPLAKFINLGGLNGSEIRVGGEENARTRTNDHTVGGRGRIEHIELDHRPVRLHVEPELRLDLGGGSLQLDSRFSGAGGRDRRDGRTTRTDGGHGRGRSLRNRN